MPKNRSLAIFSILVLALLLLAWAYTGNIIPPSGSASIWFHAGLLTLLIGLFVVEYRFTKPNDVFVNCVVVFASTSTLSNPPYPTWWELLRWGALVCGVLALGLAWDPGREARLAESRTRAILYQVVTRLGRAEVIFSVVFLLSLLSYFDLQTPEARVFVIAWGVFLLSAQLNVGRVTRIAFWPSKEKKYEVIATAHSFLAPTIVFCRRLPGRKASLHQLVGFTQGLGTNFSCFGMVIGERSSATEVRYVVALLEGSVSDAELSERSLMVAVTPEEIYAANPALTDDQLQTLKDVVGTVASRTNISQVRFEVFGSPDIAAGSLLSVNTDAYPVYYQVFEGVVDEEVAVADSARAFVEGEAEQIGYWDIRRGGFETHDWVARERAPVYLETEGIAPPIYELKPYEIAVGHIPKSNFPANVDLNDLILFHTGILGVTGSGKSFLTYEVIEKCAARGVKVVCIDPTGDYQKYLDGAVLLDRKDALGDFLESADHFIGILETSAFPQHPIKQACWAAQVCLEWCKSNRGEEDIKNPKPKVMCVFEEAHLLVPEFNFNPERGLQNDVSRTSQIVLQSRKYGLGFLVVAQRTANVVKSVLNQCNTIVSFQAFDETGFDFLKNYMGSFHVRALPNLKPRHGILVGKASRSRRPIMVRFSDQERGVRVKPVPSMPHPPADGTEVEGFAVPVRDDVGETRPPEYKEK